MPIREVNINVDDNTYKQALSRARQEGRTLEQVLSSLLGSWAAESPEPASVLVPTSPPQMTRTAPTPVSSGSVSSRSYTVYTPTAVQPTRTYTVRSGDTLGGIARDVYGDSRKYTLIARANNITDPRRIYVGQVLVIPPAEGTSTAATTTTTTTTTATASARLVVTPVVKEGAPPITWVGSPNYNRRPEEAKIWAIIVHATANSTLEGVISWFNNPKSYVSAHYTIGKDGKIVQHVMDSDRAWHAGKSSWKGVDNCNDYAIGIEMVNLNNGEDPYPEAQHNANVQLCAYLCRTYGISTENIAGHLDVAVPYGRKSDPRGYDLDRLRREVAAAVGG